MSLCVFRIIVRLACPVDGEEQVTCNLEICVMFVPLRSGSSV